MFLHKNTLILIIQILLLSISSACYATVYFKYDAESDPCDGSELPNPPFWTNRVEQRGHISCGPSPQGNRYFEFTTIDNQGAAYTEIHTTQGLPITNVIGKTFYLGFFFNFTRIDGKDIWHEDTSSADKGLEIVGSGIRWVLARGMWGGLMQNQDHRYTIFGGNPSYHLNRYLEKNDIYQPNSSGFNKDNTMQLTYDNWHSAVMVVKIAADNTGSYTAYVNGIKTHEYNNIRTAANNNPTITDIIMGGTIAQGLLDAPKHYRKFDALILTDNWQDIIDGNYLKAAPKAPLLYPPQ